MTIGENRKSNSVEKSTRITKVVLVGHCGFDQGSITRAVAMALPAVQIESVNDTVGLGLHAGPDALLLVNRVLDGQFTTNSGIDLIADLSANDSASLMMLVSNFQDAQAQAIEAGALPGFGKSDLGDPDMVQKLKAV
jgi:hypothetical protein